MTNKIRSQEWQVYIAVHRGMSIQLTNNQLMLHFYSIATARRVANTINPALPSCFIVPF
jgi:hypothetical protein